MKNQNLRNVRVMGMMPRIVGSNKPGKNCFSSFLYGRKRLSKNPNSKRITEAMERFP